MTFDPQSLYSKPKEGRGVRPVVIVGVAAGTIGLVAAMVSIQLWWPDEPTQFSSRDEIRTTNTNNLPPRLNLPEHYSPAVYAPPPPPEDPAPEAPAADPAPAFVPPPNTAPVVAGPPKKRGIPDEERVSSVIQGKTDMPQSGPGGAGGRAAGAVQVADSQGGREGFYSSAGQLSGAFKPTGIVGRLGACSLRPGAFIFHDAVGVISSDTPGQITAKTTRPIYAGPKGDCYAAPAGSDLVGTVNSNTSYGEERMQVAWTALILPNGAMVDLGGMPGAGGDGASGLPADVNNHYGALAGAVLAGTAVDVIRGMASFGGGDGDVVINMGNSLADRTASIGERLVDRELNRRPTMTAKREELTVQVTRPIDLEPYRD